MLTSPATAAPSLPILVVDDEEGMRAHMVALLRQGGFRSIALDGPLRALDFIRRGPDCAALVTDYMMPGMTGLDLCSAVKKLRPDLPVVLVSGSAGVELDARGLACHFLLKTSLRSLVPLVRQALTAQRTPPAMAHPIHSAA